MTFETRTVAAEFEMRDDTTTGAPVFEGYASVFNQPYDMGPFWEQVDKRAFDRTLAMQPDVRLLIDHEGQPLARTKSGTLTLRTDDHGLHVHAPLDPSDPDVQRLLPKMRRGDLSEMSFAFRVPAGGDDWDYSQPDRTMRTLRELNLAGGDVSVVTYPASPTTSASLRAAQTLFVERMGLELRSGKKVPRHELVKLRRAIEDLEREARGLTANDTFAALSEAVRDAYGKGSRFAYVEDYDDAFVYFTVADWSEDGEDEDMFRQGYTLAADGMATLTGTSEQVRRRSTYTVVNDPDGADAAEAALANTARSLTPDTARRLIAAANARLTR